MALRCVLVDDNLIFLDTAERVLTAQGVEVVGTAQDSAAALRLVRSVAPDVALVDIELGAEDGVELTVELAPMTPVVLISARDRDDISGLLDGSAAAGFIPKRALSADAIRSLLTTWRRDT